MTFKVVGADENGLLPTRVEAALRRAAKPTGVAATDTANIQAAIDAGGNWQLWPGTYVCNVLIKTGATLTGAGVNKTILQAPSGSVSAVITVPNFASLTGTDGSGGEKQFALRDLSVNGNRASGATGRGIALYGYYYDIKNVHVYECGSDGFYSEWGPALSATEGMEAAIDGMHIHNNNGNGFVFDGPHDSQVKNVMSWYNGPISGGFHQNGIGFWVKARASMTMFDSCHAYAHHTEAWKLEGSAHLINCQGEGADTQVKVLYNDCSIIGGQFYKSTGVGNIADQVGIEIGSTSPSVSVAGLNVNTKVVGCIGGSIKFINSGGGNSIRVNGWQPSGSFTTGTPHAFDRVDFNFHGQAAAINRLWSMQRTGDTFSVPTINDLPTSGLWSAHRGSGSRHTTPTMTLAPENTLGAFELAYRAGAHILDVDAQRTDDDIMVAMHDTTVDRTCFPSTGNVSAYPSHALPLVDMRTYCGNGWIPEEVPTIEQVLNRFGRKVCLTIEPKGGVNDVPLIAAIIHKLGLSRSVFINCDIANIATTGAAIVSNGCLLHVFNCTSVANVTAADAAGAWLIELPYNVASDRITAVNAATNIKRAIAAPLFRRGEKNALTSGLHGWVADAPLYLERTDSRVSIAAEIAAQRVGGGWYYTTTGTTMPALTPAGIKTGFESLNLGRNVMLGSLSGTKPATYSVTFNVTFGAVPSGETNTRTNLRVACPSDEGTGYDADTRGYVARLQKNGQMLLQSAPVGYGAPTTLATVGTTAIPDAGGTAVLRFDITATTVTLVRVDTSHTTGAISNTDWRGDYIWIGGTLNGVTIHDMTYTGVAVS